MFALSIAGGGFDDFYPYEFLLEEGFSRLYQGDIILLSGTCHKEDELKSLLDKRVTLTVTETLADERTTRTRSVHGLVAGVRGYGVVTGTDKQDCYWYGLTIRPEMTRLAFTHDTETFSHVNPTDIIEQEFARYGLGLALDQNYINRRKYGGNLIFNRFDEPVLTFLNRILAQYGLSYTFVHPAAAAGQTGQETPYFSDGLRFPVSDVTYSDNRAVPDVVKFDYLSRDEASSLWKMDTWRMESGAGFDGLALVTAYPDGGAGSHEWKRGKTGQGDRCWNYRKLFTGYFQEAAHAEVDSDTQLALDAAYTRQQLDKAVWVGEAKNLSLRPGAIFELDHVYGAADTTALTALVANSRLHARTVWPTNLAVLPDVEASKELVTVEARCINWGHDGPRRYVPRAA